jgi:phage shock protein PspC (stress-responsive transcriptional regulator)
VCGGLARHLGVDPALVRILFVVAALLGGPGLLAYIVLWIAIPKESAATAPAASPGGALLPSPAVRIAEERYARGEITSQDLDTIRSDLEGGRPE